jgi:hypothetical protein
MKSYAVLTIVILAGADLLLSHRVSLAKESRSSLPSLPGYEAVPVSYNSLNRMLLTAFVNGHRARFIVDTGANISILEERRARALGVSAVGHDSPYGGIRHAERSRALSSWLHYQLAGRFDGFWRRTDGVV